MKKLLTSMLIAATAVMASDAQRTSVTLTDGWQFARGTADGAPAWQNVRVPHDWAIYGPFDINNDLQNGSPTAGASAARRGGAALSASPLRPCCARISGLSER